MTTLVTGAAGFLGSHITRQLVARREDVRVLLRPSSQNRAIADLHSSTSRAICATPPRSTAP
jgi:dihydroflavonol-4-reductase